VLGKGDLAESTAKRLRGKVTMLGEEFATNSPQSETERRREMKKTAGYRGLRFCGNQCLNSYFVSIVLI
jgi:hypothetical protein